MPQRVYWDASVFHALFGSEPGRVDICLKLEKQAKDGLLEIYTSTVTFTECVWIKGNPNKLSRQHETVIQRYFMHKYIKSINCDRTIAESARFLIWDHPHLKPKDAIHVASAISQQIDVLHSYDNDHVKLSGLIGIPPLRICNPEVDPDSTRKS
jgi:predicted nucleic acid-binding protein